MNAMLGQRWKYDNHFVMEIFEIGAKRETPQAPLKDYILYRIIQIINNSNVFVLGDEREYQSGKLHNGFTYLKGQDSKKYIY